MSSCRRWRGGVFASCVPRCDAVRYVAGPTAGGLIGIVGNVMKQNAILPPPKDPDMATEEEAGRCGCGAAGAVHEGGMRVALGGTEEGRGARSRGQWLGNRRREGTHEG